MKLFSSNDSHFAFETLKNIFWFTFIALAALGLQKIVELIEYSGGGTYLIYTMSTVEYIVLIADVVWFLAEIFKSTYFSILKTIDDIKDFKKNRK